MFKMTKLKNTRKIHPANEIYTQKGIRVINSFSELSPKEFHNIKTSLQKYIKQLKEDET